jgi:hypothetical protein
MLYLRKEGGTLTGFCRCTSTIITECVLSSAVITYQLGHEICCGRVDIVDVPCSQALSSPAGCQMPHIVVQGNLGVIARSQQMRDVHTDGIHAYLLLARTGITKPVPCFSTDAPICSTGLVRLKCSLRRYGHRCEANSSSSTMF